MVDRSSEVPKVKLLPSYERVRELFNYDPQTGLLTKSGRVMGWANGNGYLRVDIDGRKFFVHRVIVLWMTGAWPRAHVDHINLIKADNCWANIRQCTKTENQGNRTKRADNTSGHKGIHWDAKRGKWLAQICRDQKRNHIGRFVDLAAARAAYASAAAKLYGEFARVS